MTEMQRRLIAKLHHKHPYVQKLNRSTRSLPQGGQTTGTGIAIDAALMRYYRTLKCSLERMSLKPKISVIIPVYKVKHSYLQECLGSLEAQIYQNWEACIVDDCSQDPGIDQIITAFIKRNPHRVVYAKNEKNLHISLASNRALEMATGQYIAFFDHDDRLLPNALAEVVRFINLHEEPEILYSDECIIDEDGDVIGTYHKPDWSPFMHLSVNYTTHFSVYQRQVLDKIGGCRAGFEGAQDHDVMMRAVEVARKPVVHIPINLYQWRSHKLSTASSSGAKPYAAIAGIKAVEEACARRGRPATVEFESQIHHYKVKFHLQKPEPLVSIIILSKDGYNLLQTCLAAIFEKSTYKNFEVILVDHESKDPQCLQLMETYLKLHQNRFSRLPYKGEFNFAAMNNLGVNQARGDYLVLMNNDTEVITPDWIQEMLALAQFPEVGAVGAKLLYPNRRIQHAGIVGLGSQIAGHIGLLEKSDSLGYFAYHQTTHEVLAVTGACLMVEKAKYLKVGGLEEKFVPNGFGDVDFCLKLRQSGFNNLYVPYACLYHKESVTRKVSFELFEKYYMLRTWSKELLIDPYRNVGFELGHQMKVDEQYRIQEPSANMLEKLMSGIEVI
jgi:GT2 family glycosyltransferase